MSDSSPHLETDSMTSMPELEVADLQDKLLLTGMERKFYKKQLEDIAESIGLVAVAHGLELKGSNPVNQMRQIADYMLFVQLPEKADLERLSKQDQLTGLLNKVGFQEKAQLVIEQTRREADKQTRHSVVFFDVDNFKSFNTLLGHPAADTEVLQVLAGLVTDNIRHDKGDIAGRFGGEEFMLLLPGATAEATSNILDRIRAECGQKRFKYDQLSLGFSAGVYEVTAGISYDEALGRAETAERVAKKLPGKNQTIIWTPDL